MNEVQFHNLLQKCYRNTNFVLNAVDQDNTLLNRKNITSEYTLLNYACLFQNFELVKGLVKRGCNIHSIDCHGTEPLYWAVGSHNKNIVSFLLKMGANPSTKSDFWTALGSAAIYADLEICILLLSYGADLYETMWGIVSNVKENSTALELYGEFYGIDSDKKKKHCDLIRLAWANGPHPSQVKRRNWERRWPFMQVVVFHGYQPLEYRLKLLFASALPTSSHIPDVDINTPEQLHAFRMGLVFSSDICRKIVLYL